MNWGTRRRWTHRLTGLMLTLVPSLAAAQFPAGDQFQVNTYTTNEQERASVGPDGGGGFVVVWHSNGSSGTDTGYSIQAQRYASDGSPAGTEFQVNTYTPGGQLTPAVGPDGAGGFVVAWTDDPPLSGADTSASVQAQRFASDGSPIGDQFQVNSSTSGSQSSSAIGPDGAGGFVVVWNSESSSGTDTDRWSIQAQRFGADGSPLGSEFQVNTYTTDYQAWPAVGPDGAGGIVVVWESDGSNGTDSYARSIQAQRFAADGSPVGGEFQVNTYTSFEQRKPDVSADGDGGFVVVWESRGSNGTDTSDYSIQAQRFLGDGSPVGDQFQVNTYTTHGQEEPVVGPDGTGGFVVAWYSLGSSGSDNNGFSVQAQRFGADGSSIGSEFQVNTYAGANQVYPALAEDGAGGFVVAWESYGSSGTDTDEWSIQAQRFTDGAIFSDGFESGDTSAWSATVP